MQILAITLMLTTVNLYIYYILRFYLDNVQIFITTIAFCSYIQHFVFLFFKQNIQGTILLEYKATSCARIFD